MKHFSRICLFMARISLSILLIGCRFSENKNGAFIEAIKRGDINFVEKALKNGMNPNATICTDTGERQSAMLWAANCDRVDIVRLLIKYGADIDGLDGDSPLLAATSVRSTRIMEILLQSGADVDYPTHNGVTSLHIAAGRGPESAVEMLIEQYGAKVNVISDKQKETPLMVAARAGQSDIVKYLMSKGADTNAKNYQGLTAAMMARKNGHNEIADYIGD